MPAVPGQHHVDPPQVLGALRVEQERQRPRRGARGPRPAQSTRTMPPGVATTFASTKSGWVSASGSPSPVSSAPTSASAPGRPRARRRGRGARCPRAAPRCRRRLGGRQAVGQVMPGAAGPGHRADAGRQRVQPPEQRPEPAKAARPARIASRRSRRGTGPAHSVTSTARPSRVETGSSAAQRSAGNSRAATYLRIAASPATASAGRRAGNHRATQSGPSARPTRHTPTSRSVIAVTSIPYRRLQVQPQALGRSGSASASRTGSGCRPGRRASPRAARTAVSPTRRVSPPTPGRVHSS